MLNNWPFFYSMMDMLDMVLTKTDQRVIKFYEECLANHDLKNTGEKLRQQLSSLPARLTAPLTGNSNNIFEALTKKRLNIATK